MKRKLDHLRRRLGQNSPGITIGVIAVIFALCGGAFAAAGLNSKQKKEVKTIAKGLAGKNGKDGAPGSTGPIGPAGPAGKDGSNGANGTNGTSPTGTQFAGSKGGCTEGGVEFTGAKFVCNGVKGANGTPGAPGTDGAPGQDAGFNYTFSSNTESTDPGAGKLKFDNASLGSATQLLISEADANSNSISAAVGGWLSGADTKGTLLVRKVGSPGTFAQYSVYGGILCTTAGQKNLPSQCAIFDEGEYDKFKVKFVSGNGTIANDDPVTIAYFATGSVNLPSGVVETGSWSFSRAAAGGDKISVPISFSIPLPTAAEGGGPLDAAHVHFQEEANFSDFDEGGTGTEGCKGTPAAPIPPAGHLCVYRAALISGTSLEIIHPANSPALAGAGAGRLGAVLLFSVPTGATENSGTFAVRAP
jgi:hypothetical protein